MSEPKDFVVTFGRYKGRRIDTIPAGYLHWAKRLTDADGQISGRMRVFQAAIRQFLAATKSDAARYDESRETPAVRRPANPERCRIFTLDED